ncbi:MAG: hypothetical protein ACKO34_06580 [Vampirovibrionales bacterium]
MTSPPELPPPTTIPPSQAEASIDASTNEMPAPAASTTEPSNPQEALDTLGKELLDGFDEADLYAIADVMALPPKAQLAVFQQHPVRFMLSFLDAFGTMLKRHTTLVEAIQAHRTLDPEMNEFLPLVLSTLKSMEIKGDLNDTLTWAEAIQKAKEQVQANLMKAAQHAPNEMSLPTAPPPTAVGKGQRSPNPGEPPTFTSKQIQAMSLAEFTKHKEAIFKAYKEGRVL